MDAKDKLSHLHSLQVIDKSGSESEFSLKLDDFDLKGVKFYEIRNSAGGLAELTVSMYVRQVN